LGHETAICEGGSILAATTNGAPPGASSLLASRVRVSSERTERNHGMGALPGSDVPRCDGSAWREGAGDGAMKTPEEVRGARVSLPSSEDELIGSRIPEGGFEGLRFVGCGARG
jgi:hypothetical protein